MASKRKYYLIDTENTGASWIRELPELSETDKVYLFYTLKSGTYRHEEVEEILKLSHALEWVRCSNGHPNALDFQLATWLGSRAEAAPKSTYIIVSNDHGYDAVCSFWNERGVAVSRMPLNTARPKISREKNTEPYTRNTELRTTEGTPTSPDAGIENFPMNPPLDDEGEKPDEAAAPLKDPGAPSKAPPGKVPESIRKSISTSLKKKYATEANIATAYRAILSGDYREIHKAAYAVCDCSKDSAKMEKHWKNLINCAKKASGK